MGNCLALSLLHVKLNVCWIKVAENETCALNWGWNPQVWSIPRYQTLFPKLDAYVPKHTHTCVRTKVLTNRFFGRQRQVTGPSQEEGQWWNSNPLSQKTHKLSKQKLVYNWAAVMFFTPLAHLVSLIYGQKTLGPVICYNFFQCYILVAISLVATSFSGKFSGGLFCTS